MRLGGPLFEKHEDPRQWAEAVKALGYSAAFTPLPPTASDEQVRGVVRAAEEADILLAEVGAWSNPISPDEKTRQAALKKCVDSLALAERLGARCCVNIAGSRGAKWDGPHPDNLTDDTFDLVVQTVRAILDAVKPTRTSYTLETMPWIFPDSPDSYLRLIRAIDRKQFGVHLDPVNMVNGPARYFDTGAFIRQCFATLGPWIRSCHGKDILMQQKLTLHLDEVRPGTGALDYPVFLRELGRLDPDTPLMLEHLPNAEEYALAAAHVRDVAQREGVDIR